LEDENEQIQQELEQVSELTDIKAKEDEILQRQAAVIAKDSGSSGCVMGPSGFGKTLKCIK
jgi:predicted ATPase with chaperone activity